MAYSLEAALHIPLSLMLISTAVLRFPEEYFRVRDLVQCAFAASTQTADVYKVREVKEQSYVESNPESALELILWTADSFSEIDDFIREGRKNGK